MKVIAVTTALAATLATAATADSLCGRTDAAVLLQTLAGAWDGTGGVWVETETVSSGETLESSAAYLGGNGLLDLAFLEGLGAGAVEVKLAPTYDVDQIDDFLTTTESDWIADELSDTPCGPEALPQFTGEVDEGPDLTGTATVVAYFDDRALLVLDLETRGDWGYAEVTVTTLLTRAD